MRILELTNKECFAALTRLTMGRLACARDNQPYIVPIHFAYHQKHLYSFATRGQKVDWMRNNPLVCVEIDEIINRHDWMSVIVQGRFEELRDTPEWKSERVLTHALLQHEAMWWEPAYIGTAHLNETVELVPVYYRIQIDQVTGRCGKPDHIKLTTTGKSAPPAKSKHWLQSFWPRL